MALNLLSLADWLSQNILVTLSIVALLLLLIFAPSVFNFFGHVIQVVFAALPKPAKAIVGLMIVLLLGAVLFNYTIGAQYVCVNNPETNAKQVAIVGYEEGLLYKFGIDIVGLDSPTYTEKPKDSKMLAVNEVVATSGTLFQGWGILDAISLEPIDVSNLNIVTIDNSVEIGDATYETLSIVVPPNEIGTYKVEAIALLPTIEMMFHRKFGDMNYAIYDVCMVPEGTCLLLPRMDPAGFQTDFEYVSGGVAGPCDRRSYTGSATLTEALGRYLQTESVQLAHVASISYALVSPEDLPNNAPADAKAAEYVYYFSEGMWIGVWGSNIAIMPKDAGFFSRIYNKIIAPIVPGLDPTWPYVDVSACIMNEPDEDNPMTTASVYAYDPYMMQLETHEKVAQGPVYNALLVPLMAGCISGSSAGGDCVLVPYGDAIEEGNQRAQVWHDTLLANIEKYSAKDGDLVTYSCTEDGESVIMKIGGINFFDPVVLIAIFIMTGAITVYGWIMRL